MRWYGNRRAEKLPHLDKDRILVIDTETTGLRVETNEILQITVLNGYGSQLLHSYIKPVRRKTWKSAQKIHGISSEMVKDAPVFAEIKSELQKIFDKADLIVGYNVNFDINFLKAAGLIIGGKTFDVMYEFAAFRKDAEGTTYRTCKLIECAEYYSYSFIAHDSKEDAEATLHCFNCLINDADFITLAKKEPEKERTKRKTKFTLKIPTIRKMHTVSKGLWCVLIGELLFAYTNKSLLLDFEKYVALMRKLPSYFESSYLEALPQIVISLGLILLIIGCIKMILSFPRWIASRFRRIFSKIF